MGRKGVPHEGGEEVEKKIKRGMQRRQAMKKKKKKSAFEQLRVEGGPPQLLCRWR
jgi:hypothetical protein